MTRASSVHVSHAIADICATRAAPNDKRPEILLWYFCDVAACEPIVVNYIACRMHFFDARSRHQADVDTMVSAIVDAMILVRYPQRRSQHNLQRARAESGLAVSYPIIPSISERARECGVRKQRYRELREAAQHFLLEAIRTGIQQYFAIDVPRADPPRELLPTHR